MTQGDTLHMIEPEERRQAQTVVRSLSCEGSPGNQLQIAGRPLFSAQAAEGTPVGSRSKRDSELKAHQTSKITL